MREDFNLVLCIVAVLIGTIVIIFIEWFLHRLTREFKDIRLDYLASDANIVALVYHPGKNRVEFVSDSASWMLGLKKERLLKDIRYLFESLNIPQDDAMLKRLYEGTTILTEHQDFVVEGAEEDHMTCYRVKVTPCGDGRFFLTVKDRTREIELTEMTTVAIDALEQERQRRVELLAVLAGQHMQDSSDDLLLDETSMAYRQFLKAMDEVTKADRPLKIAPFSLGELVEEIVTFFSLPIRSKGQKLRLNLSVAEDIVVGDRARLRLVIQNLLENAILYTPKGGTMAFLIRQIRAEKNSKCKISIVIEDEGIGIEESFIPKLFEPFERSSDPRVQEVSGLGIGLLIAKRAVDAMGGKIEVESEAGRGSRFEIKLELDCDAST